MDGDYEMDSDVVSGNEDEVTNSLLAIPTMSIVTEKDNLFRETENWCKMPRRMLRNRTLCQGERIAFGIAGIYSPDEAEDFSERAADYEVVPPIKIDELSTAPDEDKEEDEIEAKVRELRNLYTAGETSGLWSLSGFLQGLGLPADAKNVDAACFAIIDAGMADETIEASKAALARAASEGREPEQSEPEEPAITDEDRQANIDLFKNQLGE